MELRIKTSTYGDGLKKFEIVEKHSIRIFGKVIAEWYTPFEETSFCRVQSHIYSRITKKVLDKRHFEYYTIEEAEAAKRMFETGPIKYRGHKIIPIHNIYPEIRGDYYVVSKNDYICEGRIVMQGYIGSLDECKNEIDSITIVKSVIE